VRRRGRHPCHAAHAAHRAALVVHRVPREARPNIQAHVRAVSVLLLAVSLNSPLDQLNDYVPCHLPCV
jgi:hypothetical protein